MSLAPVVYFAYNRPDHAKRSLTAISEATGSDKTHLYIFCDGPKEGASEETLRGIDEVRAIAREKKWAGEVTIMAREKNRGLMKSISTGISEIVSLHGRVIVIEDDVVISKGFLSFMNEALDLYANEEKVMHVGGFSPIQGMNHSVKESTFIYNHTYCWGWATWDRAWKHFNTDAKKLRAEARRQNKVSYINLDHSFETYWGLYHIAEGKFQSWNYFWHTVVNLQGGLCLHPVKSLIQNIGFDGSGTNCESPEDMPVSESVEKVELQRIPLEENPEVRKLLTSRPLQVKLKFILRHYLKYIIH